MRDFPTSSIDPFSEEFLANPFAFHDQLRDPGPVVKLERYNCYAMARHAEVQAGLKDWETYTSARGVGLTDFAKEKPWRPPSLLLEADPPLHDRTRSLMNKVVSLASLREFSPHWRAKAGELVQGLQLDQDVDAVKVLAEAFPMAIFPDLIGLRQEGREHLLPYAESVFNAFGPQNRLLEESQASTHRANEWIAQSCQRENLAPDGWGMSVYEAADRNDCSPEEAARLVRSFLSAGVDTTVSSIANLMHAFAEHPEEWAMLRQRPALIRSAIEESLRWGGVIQTFFRTTSRPVEIAGGVIPEGAKVLLFLAAANRDPRKWDDPDQFRITRKCSGHVAFGFGIHQCLGQMVGRLEMEALVEAMLPKIAQIVPVGPAKVRLNNTLRALESVPVKLVAA